MEALARVFMLIERRAVEAGEAMGIGGEMGGDPVEEHPDPGAMRAIDKAGKALRIAKTRRGA
jgi:hypothetical protein